MALLTDQNLVNYKKALDELSTQINSWSTFLTDASTVLNKGTGSEFRANYSIGKKASTNMQTVIDILQSLQKDLQKLITDANAFYTASYNASKK